MSTLTSMPDWLGAAAIGAILAAIGYVAKLFVEGLRQYRETKYARVASLVRLQSLLQASSVSFAIQNKHARRLAASIEARHPELAGEGYERVLAKGYADMTEDERELHAMIRCITINALNPTNKQMLDWLRDDTYFKAQHSRENQLGVCANSLSQLEAHLLLWRAKYEAWIPEHPEHALIYLADEEAHGVGFPRNIDEAVRSIVRDRAVTGR